MFKLVTILLLILIPFTLSNAFAAFNIQTDGFSYKITGVTDKHTYTHEIINNNSTLLLGRWSLSPANNEQSIPLPFQNKTGEYTWNWYVDSAKSYLVDSIKWSVLDLSVSKKEVSNIVSIAVDTSQSQYHQGDFVVISGTITPIEWATPVTMQLVNEKNRLMGISQIIPKDDGSFKWTFLADGYNWNHPQKVSVRVHYLEEMSIIDFDFIEEEKIKRIQQ